MIVEFILLILLAVVSCYQCYNAGIKEGAVRTVDKLHEAKIIAFDNEGEIYPNPFFDRA
tara:strand:+ start:543 stop:719 length:177 start_codon:yes stop_codon:yes gene_type:complete